MSMPERIQLRRTPGWRMPPNTVKVDRATKWGNPFIAGRMSPGESPTMVLNNRHAFELYQSWAPAQDELVRNARAELRGKNLACWCFHPNPAQVDTCHASVLLEIANASDE